MSRHNLLAAIACIAMASQASAIDGNQLQQWSLDQCIAYAIDHNITVRSRSLDVSSAELEVSDARNRFLPAFSGNAGQQFNFGRGLTSDNTYANRNTRSSSFGVGMDLPIFQGLAGVRRLDYAKANLRTVVEQLDAARDNVELNVISLYLQVLYCREVESVAREQVGLSEMELERRRTLVDTGKIPELDLYEAEAQLERDRLSLTNAVNDSRLALLDLSQMLQLPSDDGFDIAPISDTPAVTGTADQIYSSAVTRNHGVLAAQLAIEAARCSERLASSGYLPTISLSAGLSSSYYSVNGRENPPFRSQMRDNFNKYIGLSLSVPIFDRFSTRNSVRRAKVQRRSAELQAEQVMSDLYKAIQQARRQASAAEAKLSAAAAAENASLKAFEGMRVKYDYGKATSVEYEQARVTWVKSTLEHTQAQFELILRQRILQFYMR